MKPQRIFNCDSGWSIDLDMITYIGIPEILDTKVTLKIGMKSVISKDESFITHVEYTKTEQNEVYQISNIHLLNELHNKNIIRACENDLKTMWDNTPTEMQNEIGAKSRITLDLYVEHEFRIVLNKLKTAWNEWVNCKELIPAPQTCPVCYGNGLVMMGFYSQAGGTWDSSGANFEQCKSCKGKGAIWKEY